VFPFFGTRANMAAISSPPIEQYKLIARVAYVTGWRHGEVVQLRRKNLDRRRPAVVQPHHASSMA
jgi:integrase